MSNFLTRVQKSLLVVVLIIVPTPFLVESLPRRKTLPSWLSHQQHAPEVQYYIRKYPRSQHGARKMYHTCFLGNARTAKWGTCGIAKFAVFLLFWLRHKDECGITPDHHELLLFNILPASARGRKNTSSLMSAWISPRRSRRHVSSFDLMLEKENINTNLSHRVSKSFWADSVFPITTLGRAFSMLLRRTSDYNNKQLKLMHLRNSFVLFAFAGS